MRISLSACCHDGVSSLRRGLGVGGSVEGVEGWIAGGLLPLPLEDEGTLTGGEKVWVVVCGWYFDGRGGGVAGLVLIVFWGVSSKGLSFGDC